MDKPKTRREQLHADLNEVIEKHQEWIHDEAWMRACNSVGYSQFPQMARHNEAIERFVGALDLNEPDDDEEMPIKAADQQALVDSVVKSVLAQLAKGASR